MEKTAVKCYRYSCDYSEVIPTPARQKKLVELVNKLKHCPKCCNISIIQIGWVDDKGTFGGS